MKANLEERCNPPTYAKVLVEKTKCSGKVLVKIQIMLIYSTEDRLPQIKWEKYEKFEKAWSSGYFDYFKYSLERRTSDNS